MARLAPATGAAVVAALLARWATDGMPAIAVAPLSLTLAGVAYVLVAAATGVAEAGLLTDPIRRRLHL